MRTGKSVQLTRRLVRRRQSACDRREVGLDFHTLASWDSGLHIETWALHFLGPSNTVLLLHGNCLESRQVCD